MKSEHGRWMIYHSETVKPDDRPLKPLLTMEGLGRWFDLRQARELLRDLGKAVDEMERRDEGRIDASQIDSAPIEAKNIHWDEEQKAFRPRKETIAEGIALQKHLDELQALVDSVDEEEKCPQPEQT